MSRQALKKQPVAPAGLVRGVLADLLSGQEGRRIELIVGDLPVCEADPMLLRQVFVNLPGNAFKYSSQREKPVIEVGCRNEDGQNVYFSLGSG